MVRDIGRREFLVGTGTAGTVGLAGCIGGGGSGNGGGDGGDGGDGGTGGPDMLVVIGYPESGIQLFRDYYSMTDGQHTDNDLQRSSQASPTNASAPS